MDGVLRVGPPTVEANRFSSLTAQFDDDLEGVVPIGGLVKAEKWR